MLAPVLTLLTYALGGQPTAAQDVCPEMRDLVPDLVEIDRARGSTHRHVVSDARVKELERRLAKYLGLPRSLRVRLTTSTGHRREVAKNGVVTMTVEHEKAQVDLGLWTATWNGECVTSSGPSFLRSTGPDPTSCSAHPHSSHYSFADLPQFFEQLSQTAVVATSFRHPVERVSPLGGSPNAQPPFARVRAGYRLEHGTGEAFVSAVIDLPLGQASAIGAATLGPLVTAGFELADQIDLAVPHSIQIAAAPNETAVFRLTLDPYIRDQLPLPITVHVRLDADRDTGAKGRWAVSDAGRLLPFGAVDLSAFMDLVNHVAEMTSQRDQRVGAFGIAYNEDTGTAVALLVLIDEETLWEAKGGALFLLERTAENVVDLVEETVLPLSPGPTDKWTSRTATAASGKVFRIEVADGEILRAQPKPTVLRYGDHEFALAGGRAID